jgi:hypothetical protein
MIAAAVYLLCVLTSAFCALLLLLEYRRRGARLLLWSGAAFVSFTAANALLFVDFVMLPEIDLSLFRSGAGSVSVAILLYGLVWDTD